MNKLFVIKTTSVEGNCARTYVFVHDDITTIVRRLLVKATELKELPNYTLLRNFKDMALIETFIPFKNSTLKAIFNELYNNQKLLASHKI